MKSLVLATLYIMLANGQSETKQIRIEPKFCGTVSQAEVPLNGEWYTGKVGIKC